MSKLDSGLPALSRRRFLSGTATTLVSMSALGSLLGTAPLAAAPGGGKGRRPSPAIFQEMPYFDFTGQGAAYVPPRSAARSTSNYTRGLSQEEFLRRHYYS